MLHIDFSEPSCVVFFLAFFFVKLGSAMTKLGSAIALSNDLITLGVGGSKIRILFFGGFVIIPTIFGSMSICVAIFGHLRFGRYF